MDKFKQIAQDSFPSKGTNYTIPQIKAMQTALNEKWGAYPVLVLNGVIGKETERAIADAGFDIPISLEDYNVIVGMGVIPVDSNNTSASEKNKKNTPSSNTRSSTSSDVRSPTRTSSDVRSPTRTSTEVRSPTRTSTEVRSPTRTSTEVRSPTRTATEVRSPTRTATSTDAYTANNITVTGGAGAGATTVTVRIPAKEPMDKSDSTSGALYSNRNSGDNIGKKSFLNTKRKVGAQARNSNNYNSANNTSTNNRMANNSNNPSNMGAGANSDGGTGANSDGGTGVNSDSGSGVNSNGSNDSNSDNGQRTGSPSDLSWYQRKTVMYPLLLTGGGIAGYYGISKLLKKLHPSIKHEHIWGTVIGISTMMLAYRVSQYEWVPTYFSKTN